MIIFLDLQLILIFELSFKVSYIDSPQPIAAGISNSEHLMVICEAAPPYFVIKPLIPWRKIQSYPGSAPSIRTILSFNS